MQAPGPKVPIEIAYIQCCQIHSIKLKRKIVKHLSEPDSDFWSFLLFVGGLSGSLVWLSGLALW